MKENVWRGSGPLTEAQFTQLAKEYGTPPEEEDVARISVYWLRISGEHADLDEYFEWHLDEDGALIPATQILRPGWEGPDELGLTDGLAGLNELYEYVAGHPDLYDKPTIFIEVEDGQPDSTHA